MQFQMEQMVNYKIAALSILVVFYGIYFGKMFSQKRQGIQTRQIGTRKEVWKVESLMSAATSGIVFVQLISIIFEWNWMPPNGRFTGFVLGFAGNLLFLIAVCTMKDSWRAGIPEKDQTRFVTEGIFKYSRNPAFLGFDLMYTGVLLIYLNPLNILFTGFVIVMLHLQILQEERYLQQRFGEEYVAYKEKVSRYLGRRKG